MARYRTNLKVVKMYEDASDAAEAAAQWWIETLGFSRIVSVDPKSRSTQGMSLGLLNPRSRNGETLFVIRGIIESHVRKLLVEKPRKRWHFWRSKGNKKVQLVVDFLPSHDLIKIDYKCYEAGVNILWFPLMTRMRITKDLVQVSLVNKDYETIWLANPEPRSD